MTELVAADNTQILLPNGQVWGSAIVNRSSYPGTGELKVTLPVRAGPMASTVGDALLEELRKDAGLDPQIEPAAHVSKVIELPEAGAAVVELTLTARVKPSEADAVKARLLDRAS